MFLVLLRLCFLGALVVGGLYFLVRLLSRPSVPRREGFDPYVILGISRQASQAEIQSAYHRELTKYHPDKVAHLGEEIQKVAQARTTQIIEAYQLLKRESPAG